MLSTTNTPPQNFIKVIFPYKTNQHLVDKAAIAYGIIAYPEQNIILFEGDCYSDECRQVRSMLTGGVPA